MFNNRKTRRAAGLLTSGSMATLGLMLAAAPALAQTELSPVQVQGEGSGSYTAPSALDKLPEPMLDTPVSATTVTQQLMKDRGETNLNDAFRNVPSITLQSNESSFLGNDPFIRGFNARTDMFLDGMRDIGMYYRDPFNLTQVEVLEGPDSILFGRGSTGGVIEQDSKTPQAQQFIDGSISAGTNNLIRATADINMPLEGTGVPVALRLNVMANTNGTQARDVVRFARAGIAPSLAIGLGTDTRLTLSYLYQSENDIPDFGQPWYFGAPPKFLPRNNYYGYAGDRFKTSANVGTIKLEHDFADWLTVSGQSRYASYSYLERAGKPTLTSTVTLATPLSAATITPNDFTVTGTQNQLQNQVNALAKFAIGDIQNDLQVGGEYDVENSDPRYFTNTGLVKSLLTLNEAQPFTPTLTYQRVNIKTDTNTLGGYLTDTMKFGDQWQLVLGARIDRFSVHFREQLYSVPPAVTGVITATNVRNHVDTLPSWRGALIYKPAENGTVYFSYGTSFNPTAETLNVISSFTTFSLNNAALGPERNQSFELGTKWALFGGLNASASIFETDKVNARIPDLSLPGFNTLGGNQRVQGFELTGQGKIMDGWNASLGYDYLSSDTTKTVAGGPPLGLPLVFTPHNHVTFWTSYDVLPKLTIGGGGEYQGSRYAQTSAPIEKAPDYMTFDAMAKYAFADNFDLQLNVYNLTDRHYFDMMHFAFVVPGAGRSAMLTLNYHS